MFAKLSLTRRMLLMSILLVVTALISMALIIGISAHNFMSNDLYRKLQDENRSFNRIINDNRGDLDLLDRRRFSLAMRELSSEYRRTLSNTLVFYYLDGELEQLYFLKPVSPPDEVLSYLAEQYRSGETRGEFTLRNGKHQYCYIQPIEKLMYQKQSRAVPGLVVTYSSTDTIQEFNQWMMITLSLAALIGTALASAIGLWMARRIAQPLVAMQEQVERLANREYDEAPAPLQTGDEMEALSRTLGEAGARMKEYDQQQRQFFQNLSHELKTPLMSIQGYAEGIRDGLFADSGQALDIIIRESRQLKRQIEDISYLLKMDMLEGFFNLETLSMNALIAEAIRRVEGIALRQDIDIEYEPGADCLLRVDGEKIITVLTNLLTNCIKYGRSRIIISSRSLEQSFELQIGDDGDGFSDEDLLHIFDRFYKGKKAGTGLGMAIARQIVERHQGSLAVRNAAEGGAVFIVHLPTADNTAAES